MRRFPADRSSLARSLAARSAALAPTVLASALFAACDRAPLEPSAVASAATSIAAPSAAHEVGLIRHVDEYPHDLTDRTVSLGCEDGTASEVVRLTGGLVDRVTHMQLPTGTVVSRHQSRPEGLSGVGLTSGHAYDVVHRVHSWDVYADRGVLGHHREVWTLRDRATGAVYGLTYTVHYAMDADRNLIVNRQWENPVYR